MNRFPQDETGGQTGPTAIRNVLTNRRILMGIAALAISGGLAFNWSWLVAVGLGPILLAIAPCAIMCALGLCAHRMMK